MTLQPPTFVAPPGWPPAPDGFRPAAEWSPDPAWPPAPEGWQFWVGPDGEPATAPEGSWTGPTGHAPTMPLPTTPTAALPTVPPPAPAQSPPPWSPPPPGQPMSPVPPIPQAGSPWGAPAGASPTSAAPAGMPSDPFRPPPPSAPGTYPGGPAYPGGAGGPAYPVGPGGPAYPGGPAHPGAGHPAGAPRKSKTPLILGVVGVVLALLVGGFIVVRGLVADVVAGAKPTPSSAPTTAKTPVPSSRPTQSSAAATAPTASPAPSNSLILTGPTLTKAQFRKIVQAGKLGTLSGTFTDTVNVSFQPSELKGIPECDALAKARKGYIISTAMQTVDLDPAYSLLFDSPASNLKDRTDEDGCFAKARAKGLSGYDELDVEVIEGVETRSWVDNEDTDWLEVKYGNVDVTAPLSLSATDAERLAFVTAVKAQVDAAAQS